MIDNIQVVLGTTAIAFTIGGSIAWVWFRLKLRKIKQQIPKELIENVKRDKSKPEVV